MFEVAQGELVRIDGRLYKFQHRARNGNLCFMDPEEGNPVELTEEDLLAKFAKGEIKLRVAESAAIDPRNLDLRHDPAAWQLRSATSPEHSRISTMSGTLDRGSILFPWNSCLRGGRQCRSTPAASKSDSPKTNGRCYHDAAV
jgi:hypothetical protein